MGIKERIVTINVLLISRIQELVNRFLLFHRFSEHVEMNGSVREWRVIWVEERACEHVRWTCGRACEHVDAHVGARIVKRVITGHLFFIALVRTRVLPVVMCTGASSNSTVRTDLRDQMQWFSMRRLITPQLDVWSFASASHWYLHSPLLHSCW